MNRVTRAEAVESLRRTTCGGCGGKKRSAQAFCSDCYFKLPEALRRALFRRIGDGYEQAYTDALAFLAAKALQS